MTDAGLEPLGDTVRLEYVEHGPPVGGAMFSRVARRLAIAANEDADPESSRYLARYAHAYDRLAVRAGRVPCTDEGARYARRRRRMARKGRRGYA